MRLNKKLFVSTVIAFFAFGGIVYASTSNFLPQAQKFIKENCNKKKLNDEEALLCYLFNKSIEQDTSIASINTTLSPIPNEINNLQSQIEDLQSRVTKLEATPTPTPTPTSTPTPTPITSGYFVFNEPIDVTGFSTISTSINGYQGAAAIWYSDDKVNWTLQGKFAEFFGSKVNYVYPIKGKYYKTTSWGSGSIYYTLETTSVNAPTADFTYTPQNPKVNDTITFTDTSQGEAQRIWEFDTPYTSTNGSQIANLQVTQVGTFGVHLYV